ncbi:HNH endonuclease [Candidatus Pacearchaeota archaeon]|nr:HNH endonuclease [Candidatus Pacearchaeota archaeon]
MRRIIKLCRYCNKEVHNLYCNASCHNMHKREILLKRWINKELSHLPHPVKNYILDEQDHRCILCDIPDEWQGKKLVFVLDHIDGDSTHNYRENLRCVCPNCDSQLPTFKSKNRGNGRHARRLRYRKGKSY